MERQLCRIINFARKCGNKFESEKQQEKKYENISDMKERVLEDPELLGDKKASKELLREERLKLAQEIIEQRKLSRENLIRLKEQSAALNAELENKNTDWEKAQKGI